MEFSQITLNWTVLRYNLQAWGVRWHQTDDSEQRIPYLNSFDVSQESHFFVLRMLRFVGYDQWETA
jgi:hypothetical protein